MRTLARNFSNEVRNERQQQNITAISMLLLFLVDSNDISAVNTFEKVTVTGDGNNNLGVWGRSFQPSESIERGGGSGDRTPMQRQIFQIFSHK